MDIKNLFNKSSNSNSSKQVVIDDYVETIIDEKDGVAQAGALQGSLESLDGVIEAVIRTVHQKICGDETYQEEQKNRLKNQLSDICSDIEKAENNKKAYEKDLNEEKEEIEKHEEEKIKIKAHPENYMDEKPAGKIPFIINVTILIALTIYVIIFYGSAAYSAIFKEFSLNNIGVANAIFDAQAYTHALNDGVGELLLIMVFPAAFFALGLLLHKFLLPKTNGIDTVIKYCKAASLYIVTFIFDTLLAYGITRKIYQIHQQNSFSDMPDYTLSKAFVDVDFWTIIFCGFIVYLIWGLLYDYVIELHRKMDIKKTLIEEHNNYIEESKKKCEELDNDILEQTNILSDLKSEKEKIERQLEITIVPYNTVKLNVRKFMAGWCQFMKNSGASEEQVAQANAIADRVLEEYKSTLIIL